MGTGAAGDRQKQFTLKSCYTRNLNPPKQQLLPSTGVGEQGDGGKTETCRIWESRWEQFRLNEQSESDWDSSWIKWEANWQILSHPDTQWKVLNQQGLCKMYNRSSSKMQR